jgi:hypothetical protein
LCSSFAGLLFFPFLHNEFLHLAEKNLKYANHITLEPITPFGTVDIIGKALMSTHCGMAPFLGKISPSGDPKKGALQSLQRMFSLKIGTNSAYFKEKKAKFATFRP